MPKKTGKPAPQKAATQKSASRTGPRQLKPGNPSRFRLHKRIKHPMRLPKARFITRDAAVLIWEHRRLFAGITLIYGLANLILVQGFSSGGDVSTIKDSFNGVFQGNFGFLPQGLGVFAVLVGTSGNTTSPTAGAYQIFLTVIGSLAIIWALRQVLAGYKPRVKDTFYSGMTPLVPFLLVIIVIGFQLLPLVIGASLYTGVVNNGIALYAAEKLAWALLCGLLALLSLYLVSSSLFALYIVTLQDMTPMQALRSARGLVRYRRWTVLRKLLFLPLVLLVAAGIIMLPIIIVLTPVAQWVFFVLTMFSLVAVHAYIYTLYRELLNEQT